MITFRKLDHTTFKDVFRLLRDFDPSFEWATLDHFVVYFFKVEGIVVEDEGRIIAAMYFDNFIPECDIVIHCVADPEYRVRWMMRGKVFNWGADFVYNTLGLGRMSGYSIEGVTNKVGHFLETIGFKHEGTKRGAIFVHGEHRDLHLYGMTREESRW
jgi:hypothetical protein